MTKLFFFSVLLTITQVQLFASEPTHGENPIIESWGSKRGMTQDTYEVSLAAIQESLKPGELLDEKKIQFLTQWANKLLIGQKTLKKRAEDWLEDPNLSDKSKMKLTNLAVLYQQRIKDLNKVIEKLTLKQIREASLKQQIELAKKNIEDQNKEWAKQIETLQFQTPQK